MATLVLVLLLPGYPGKTAVSPGPELMLPNMPFNDFDCEGQGVETLKVKAWSSEIEATALRPDGPPRGACAPDNAALAGGSEPEGSTGSQAQIHT
eukprot:11034-Rhodomonas_salina.1